MVDDVDGSGAPVAVEEHSDGRPVTDGRPLRGQVALVTGSSSGIGLAIGRALGRAGARVVVTSRREEAVRSAVSALESEGTEAFGLASDVRDPLRVQELVAGAVRRFGRLDVLVNNAGGSWGDTFSRGPLTDLTGDDLLEAYRLNVVSTFLCSQQALAHLRADGGGVIVNIGSVAGIHAGPGMAAYGASKAALANLTRSMAEEWAPEVRVCGVAAGYIDTARARANRTPERLEATLRSIALGRLGTAEEVAAAVEYLVSPAAAWNTGAMLPLHGGQMSV